MSTSFTTIALSSDAGVLTITLNRPEALNAFNEQMGIELGTALKMAERDDAVRCIVITGAGRAFCSGQDLVEIKDRYGGSSPQTSSGGGSEGGRSGAGAASQVVGPNIGSHEPLDFGGHLRQKYNPIVTRMRTLEKPIIAAVNGVAAGAGASFAFAADMRIAGAGASFVMAFVHVGLIPDSGATLTLQQLVGYGKAAELCFLGEKVPAEEALRVGLVNRVVPDAELMAKTAELARRLAAMPTRAIGLTKRAMNHAHTTSFTDQLEYEAFLQQTAGNTQDHREGVRAFVEKRKAEFRGR